MRYLLLFLVLLGGEVLGNNQAFVSDYLERLQNSRKYLLDVAELMPEEKYHYKATPESLSFAENLMHIGFAMNWHSQSLLGGKPAIKWSEDTVYKVEEKTKEEMIAIVDQTFERTIQFAKNFDTDKLEDRLEYFGLDRTKRQIFMLMSDHITHHRGQMLVYLRLNELIPPRYVLYQ